MARSSSRYPTELELEILKTLWRDGPQPVRQVRDAIEPFRDLAYTSVMTVMNIMVKKKYLRRTKEGGSFVYAPRVSRQATVGDMVGDVVNRLFDGSAAAAALHLLETGDLDEDELARLRELVEHKTGSND